MKKTLVAAVGLTLLLPVASFAQSHGGGHGGSHSGGSHFGSRSGRVGGSPGFHRGFRGRVRFGFGFGGWGWGWPWGYWGLYGPYYGPYDVYGEYGYGGAAMSWAAIDTDVSPEEARVYLDGRYIGTADDFDGYPDYLYLARGHYKIEFRLDGYETKVVELDARPGTKTDINNKLHKVPGAKQYGSYDTPVVEGGLQRYFAKRGGSAAPWAPNRDRYDARPTDRRDDRYSEPEDSQDAYAAPDDEGRDQPDESPDAQAPPDETPPPPSERPRSDEWRGRPPRGSSSDSARTRLLVHARPADAAVYLDDKFIGTAEEVGDLERGVKVSPGRHRITVARPGYREKTVRIEVDSGNSRNIEVDLER